MAHRTGRKEEARARLLAGAGRGFRARGFGGLGVDGIAAQAGLTSGAFYAHFTSKAAAFREVVAEGMVELREGIGELQRTAGPRWRDAFVAFYLGERRTCPPEESCALQALSGDVARSDAATRSAYTAELERIVATLTTTSSEGAPAARARALALLALLAGGVSMARAVDDPTLSEEIAEAVRAAAAELDAPPG